MATALSQKVIFDELFRLFEAKSRADVNEFERLISEQLKVLRGLANNTAFQRGILQNLAARFSNQTQSDLMSKLEDINLSQEKVLMDSLGNDLSQIIEKLQALATTLSVEKETLRVNQARCHESWNREQELMRELGSLINAESGLAKKVGEQVDMVQKLEHRQWFINLVRGIAKLNLYRKYKVIVTGQEHVPPSGPVILASRHFHGDFDLSLMLSIIHRRIFFLGATDFLKEGVQMRVVRLVYEKMGAVPINRPDSIFQKPSTGLIAAYKSIVRLLMLGQAVMIFPEGWPNIDSHWTRKTEQDDVIEVKAGLFHFIDYVQKKKGVLVPIVPIGVRYTKEGRQNLIFVNIGTPFNIPVSAERIDFQPYMDKLYAELVELSNRE